MILIILEGICDVEYVLVGMSFDCLVIVLKNITTLIYRYIEHKLQMLARCCSIH